ncbi:unnamed protein product [Paramecium sonneborni]|uniref:Uncharacterized protein n=1 Tax=Paramecium sonneborni TaxID=65129 RepID=A0A8S1KXS0_9CILI|nr:unnamed protein product [Paramecium sonneborni]
MQEAYRIKASNKVQFENKFTQKKNQLLDSIQIQIQQVQDDLQESILKDKSEVINIKAKIIALQKQADSKNNLILEQETIIQSLILKLQELEKKELPQKQNFIDQDLLVELEQEISLLKALSHKLRLKANRLCSYFVCLRLYNAELGLKIQQDDFDYNHLVMPKIPDHSTLIQSLQESERILKQKLDLQVLQHILLGILNFKKLKQKIVNQKKKIQIQNDVQRDLMSHLIQMLRNNKIKSNNFKINQMINHYQYQSIFIKQKYLIIYKKQYEQQNQCKQLNDFILKKRKFKNEQPVFNLELVKRKLTLDVCRSREESVYTVNEPRIHSKTIQHKY